ncbi:DNA-binding protein [Streptomyces eurocidicus]|uniref:DNA-binding protein n=2 Tax=Streptomyces eurocidicus TaxID=66423 RepID=A0A2N8P2Y0_STREU|nr:DUF5753 domain-containing protein [Streptomyces eurocidicus]MBF6053372.1 helix-turn-helix domain-containing protein [Streptomyces eurocidicus]PNE35369.1 DNA-binding protein [Streptomyces eurocidicus]
MPPRSNPTARQARLGAELRKLREASGMPAGEAGALIGGGAAGIGHIEAGRWGVSAERVRRLAAHYRAGDERLVGALCAMAEERGRGWWEEFRGVLSPGFLDVSELEHHATALRLMQLTHVPGIFQTEEYARVVFGSARPRLPERELCARVAHRVGRRRVFARTPAPETEVVVHEAALRMRYGGRAVQRAQLEFLTEAAGWPHVTLRVIPFDVDGLIGTAQSMLYAVGPLPELDTVQIDSAFGGGFVDAYALVAMYRELFDSLAGIALRPEESRKLVHHVAQEL